MIPQQQSLSRSNGDLLQYYPEKITLFGDNPVRSSSFQKPSEGRKKRRGSFGRRMKRRTRHVSFAKHVGELQDAPESHGYAVAQDLWFSSQDFERFMKQAQQDSRTLKLTDEEYVDGLKETLDIAVEMSEDIELVDEIIQNLSVKSSGIADWCVDTPYRGLEKFCSRKVRTFRRQIRENLADTIVVDSKGMTAERIGARSAKRSRQSRLYARMLGLADELAAEAVYRGEADEYYPEMR